VTVNLGWPIATNGAVFLFRYNWPEQLLGRRPVLFANFISSLLLFCLSTCFESYKIGQRLAASIFASQYFFWQTKPILYGCDFKHLLFLSVTKSVCETVLWKASLRLGSTDNSGGYTSILGPSRYSHSHLVLVTPTYSFYDSSVPCFSPQQISTFLIPPLCAISILINQVAVPAYDSECVGVVSDSADKGTVGMSLNLLRNITERGSLKEQGEAQTLSAKMPKGENGSFR